METIEKCIEVEAPLDTVYNQWTQFEEFPKFMEGVEQVQQLDDKHLHWVAKVAGKRKEWDAEILEQTPNDRIAWKSTSGAPNSGVVHFRPIDHNHTMVTLRMNYDPEGPMENMGDALGVFSKRVEGDLERFRDFIQDHGTETGAWRGKIHRGRIESSGSGTGTGMIGGVSGQGLGGGGSAGSMQSGPGGNNEYDSSGKSGLP